MKKYEEAKARLNSIYGSTANDAPLVEAIMNSKKFKNLKKVLDSGYVTSYVDRLSDRELISQIFYYSGRALQDRNVARTDDAITLHFLIMEYANRYGEDR